MDSLRHQNGSSVKRPPSLRFKQIYPKHILEFCLTHFILITIPYKVKINHMDLNIPLCTLSMEKEPLVTTMQKVKATISITKGESIHTNFRD